MSQNHWHVNAVEEGQYGPLAGDINVDIAVIGAGFTGLSTALHAAKSGAKVAVIDAKHVGFGGSGRNVGLVNAGLWLPPEDVISTLGIDAGNRLIDRLSRAPDDVFDLIKTYNIQCDAHRNGTLHLAHSKSGLKDLERRNTQWKARGVDTKIIDAAEVAKRVGSDCYHGALLDYRAGVIQPFDYVRGLARAAHSHGVQIYENTVLKGTEPNGDSWTVTTPSGTICAQKIVYATNAYGPSHNVQTTPKTSCVYYFQTVSDRIPDKIAQSILNQKEGCWDTAMIMSSFRMTRDNRLVYGAMGNTDAPHGGIHKSWTRRSFDRIFPQLSNIALGPFWSGKIAMTTTKIPKVVITKNTVQVFGFSGRGIAPGTALGIDIADYLATGSTLDISVPIDAGYSEVHTQAKSAYYELGASVIHSIP